MADYTTCEPLFDWDKGDFVIVAGRPRLATGPERIKNWVHKVVRTQLGRYELYRNTGYGTNTENIIGRTFTRDFKQSEIKRDITETLLKNKSIISVDNFTLQTEGSLLTLHFNINTEYGSYNIKEVI